MSKYIILAGMVFNLAAGALHFWGPSQLSWLLLPAVSLGVVLTVGGTVSLLVRADW